MNTLVILLTASTLNWVGVSVTGYKTNEAESRYFKTEQECRTSTRLKGHISQKVCIPVPELPQEFFDAQTAEDHRKDLADPYRNQKIETLCAAELKGKQLTYKEFYEAKDNCVMRLKAKEN